MEENMRYPRLGWVAFAGAYFYCDDSPFADIFSGAGHGTYCLGLVACKGLPIHVGMSRGKRKVLRTKHLQLDYMVHIHSVMITYGVCLYNICMAACGLVGERALCVAFR